MTLAGALAARSAGYRLSCAFRMEIERYCSADQTLQGRLINLVAFVDVDGAPDVPFETGVEYAGRVFQCSSLGKCHLDDVFVCLSRTDNASVGKDGSPRRRRLDPLPLLDDLRVCLAYDFAHFRECFSAPVPKFVDLLVDSFRGRSHLDSSFHVQLQFSHLILSAQIE